MDIAVYIDDYNKITQCELPYDPQNELIKSKYGELYKEIGKYVEYKTPNRLYFGAEVCQKLIPSVYDCEKAYIYAQKHNMKFSYVTPGLFDNALLKTEDSLKLLNDYNDNIEVVCNDWGMVQLIKNKYSNLKPVLGRMIDKLSREPRLSNEQFKDIYGEEGIRFLKTPNIFVKEYQEIIDLYNIEMVELDCVPQGLNLNNNINFKYKIGIHVPFYYITTGVICMLQIMNSDEHDKYNFSNSCMRSCKNIDIIMKKSDSIYDNNLCMELIRKGNTVYNSIRNLNDYLDNMYSIERLILQYF